MSASRPSVPSVPSPRMPAVVSAGASVARTGTGTTNPLIAELKTRARLRLNALRRGAVNRPAGAADAAPGRLRDCLIAVAREAGFGGWEQALRVLGGQAVSGGDMGSFWHAPRCNGLLSHWFARHEQARECLALGEHRVLLPYRRQFVVVDDHYLRELGLSIGDKAWGEAGRDLVQAYGSAAWLALCSQRLRALRAEPVAAMPIV